MATAILQVRTELGRLTDLATKRSVLSRRRRPAPRPDTPRQA
ncbi:hypothetical protein [Streptomyces sediminimaris]